MTEAMKDWIKECKELRKENESSRRDNEILWERLKEFKKQNKELKEELKKWKDEWQEQVQKAIDEGYARTLQTMQLTKAKEIIKEWLGDFYSPLKCEKRAELIERTEKFIKE